MSRTYALLVGINAYSSPVKPLQGCLNDVDHFAHWLRENVPGERLALEMLKDNDATHDNVVRQFRDHLGQARAGDVVVFQYCGHGAQYGSAPEFRDLDSEGLDEGLVLVDSRVKPGVYDLADKELSVLIGEVAERDVHVTFILDACHSGSATRSADAFAGMRSRLVPREATLGEPVRRPLETYLDPYFTKKRKSPNLLPPKGRHVLLAACSRSQEAKESDKDRRGIFSATLMEVLEATGGRVSYADLFVRCRAAVRKRALDQDPQFEPIANFDVWSGFLGGATASRSLRHSVSFDGRGWKLDAGTLQGLDDGADLPIGLALYNEKDLSHSAGTAHTTAVGAQQSSVAFDGATPAPEERFRAAITSMPASPLLVQCGADADTLALWQAALDGPDAPLAGSGVLLSAEPAGTRYGVGASQGGGLQLQQRETGEVLREVPLAQPQALLAPLQSIARWERLAGLENRRTQIDGSKIEFIGAEVLEDGSEHLHTGGSATLESVREPDGSWSEIRLRLKVRNLSGVTLYPVLVHLCEDYSIEVWPTDPLESLDTFVTLWGAREDEVFRLEQGREQDESIDRIKLILSLTPVDSAGLAQEGRASWAHRATGSVRKKPAANDWLTRDLRVRTVPRLAGVGDRGWRTADDSIVIQPHSRLRAQVNLASAQPATRGPGEVPAFIEAFGRAELSVATFGVGTRATGDHGVIELSDIQGAQSLAEEPLQIEVRQKLAANEGLLTFAFDGTHVLPCGQATKRDDGVTQVTLDHLPETPSDRRSLGGSLKLYFFKTYLKNNDVNRLQRVEFAAGGGCKHREDDVTGAVARAGRVLLLVHGIIGDTEGMAAGIAASGLHAQFDLVLAYDYENLATPIAETARKLKQQLADVGLREDDGKHLTLLVHSMGGLVSRWFIEREGGRAVVDHLVMCGTPNFGSPFGHVDEARKLLGVLMGVAANYLPPLLPYTAPVLMLLNRSQKLTPTLAQMNPGSDFIRELNASDDPGVRYTIVAGNVGEYQEPTDALFAKLVEKLGRSFVFDALFALKAHDIAVAVDSITRVAAKRAEPPQVINVGCHHLNYFVSEVGQQALRSVAW